jgi:hypothetical protein
VGSVITNCGEVELSDTTKVAGSVITKPVSANAVEQTSPNRKANLYRNILVSLIW